MIQLQKSFEIFGGQLKPKNVPLIMKYYKSSMDIFYDNAIFILHVSKVTIYNM